MKYSSWIPSLLLAGVALAAFTVEAKLTVGDPAPKLQVGKWIQGQPVTAFDSNHIYIIEFWATWCPPCRHSIPDLNALWEKFKDKGVIVIGQDVWDTDDAVATFVKKMGSQMTYRVALDDKAGDKKGLMSETWMAAALQNGIPTAFVIDKQGIIAWIGRPWDLNESLLDEILSGHYNLPKAAVEYEKEHEADLKFQAEQDKFLSAMKQHKWDDAESALNKITNDFPNQSIVGISFEMLHFILFLDQKKYDNAYRFADSFSDSHPADVYNQNNFAWDIATWEGIQHRNLALAEKLAERANQASNGTNCGVLDTLARIQFMTGRTSEAVATEKKAVALAPGKDKKSLNRTLVDYQQGKLPQ